MFRATQKSGRRPTQRERAESRQHRLHEKRRLLPSTDGNTKGCGDEPIKGLDVAMSGGAAKVAAQGIDAASGSPRRQSPLFRLDAPSPTTPPSDIRLVNTVSEGVHRCVVDGLKMTPQASLHKTRRVPNPPSASHIATGSLPALIGKHGSARAPSRSLVAAGWATIRGCQAG
jgi:hypothetical protein